MVAKEIVILGGSYAGISTVHEYFRQLEPKLRASADSYHVTVINSSSAFWWNVAAPRQMLTENTVPFDKSFIPISDILKQYDASKWSFKHATVTNVDRRTHRGTIMTAAG